jgi:hypothetical protein
MEVEGGLETALAIELADAVVHLDGRVQRGPRRVLEGARD